MRIFNQNMDRTFNEISLFLTKDEALQMISYLKDLIESPTGNSASLENEDYQKDVTLVVYDPKDQELQGFSPRVKKVILDDK